VAESDEGISITRVFNAPRERVWQEWTEPERFADWFGGAESEMPIATVSMDVRPGGSWRGTMFSGEARRESYWHGTYHEVVEPERLVFTITDRPEEDPTEVVKVVLNDLGDGRTEMLFEQSGGGLSPKGYERAAQGWAGFFDVIAARLG
jgi:uncharacterized protein YndB with AHSA1/START domain